MTETLTRPSSAPSRLAGPARPRRPRRAIVATAGHSRTGEGAGRALTEGLIALGIDATYHGRLESAERLAAVARDRGADAVELCLGSGGVTFLRSLLSELAAINLRHVSIVIHRVD